MAWAGIAHVKTDIDYAAVGLAQQATGLCHPQADEILRRREARRLLELPAEMELAQTGHLREPGEIEVFAELFFQELRDLPQFEAGNALRRFTLLVSGSR